MDKRQRSLVQLRGGREVGEKRPQSKVLALVVDGFIVLILPDDPQQCLPIGEIPPQQLADVVIVSLLCKRAATVDELVVDGDAIGFEYFDAVE